VRGNTLIATERGVDSCSSLDARGFVFGVTCPLPHGVEALSFLPIMGRGWVDSSDVFTRVEHDGALAEVLGWTGEKVFWPSNLCTEFATLPSRVY